MIVTALFIYKICTLAEWACFQEAGVFSGNPLDQETGYLHLSLPRHLPRIVGKYFPDQTGIVFLKVPVEKVQGNLKWGPNSKGDLFPHFYGELKIEHVEAAFDNLEELLGEDPIQE